MWDDVPLMRNLSNLLAVASMSLLLYGAGHYLVHLPGVLPLQSVRLQVTPQRVDAAAVLQAVRQQVSGNLLTLDIKGLQQRLEQLPWVRSAEVRREFPDHLSVNLTEYQALARWNNSALVSQQGEVFVADTGQELPLFIGQEGTAAEVAAQYAQFNRQLARVNLHLTQLALTPRHAWQLRLNNGLLLELGREDVQQRLARFITVYPYSLALAQAEVQAVDLRYRNGFAVQFGQQQMSGTSRKS
ncbi:MAG: cell division protein FtsQ/DivIB [Pseudomonadota bacterium]